MEYWNIVWILHEYSNSEYVTLGIVRTLNMSLWVWYELWICHSEYGTSSEYVTLSMVRTLTTPSHFVCQIWAPDQASFLPKCGSRLEMSGFVLKCWICWISISIMSNIMKCSKKTKTDKSKVTMIIPHIFNILVKESSRVLLLRRACQISGKVKQTSLYIYKIFFVNKAWRPMNRRVPGQG